MNKHNVRIYCAGPLFNQGEKEKMKLFADEFERVGFATFLPQRDGFEGAKIIEELVAGGYAPGEAGALVSRAIFALDSYQVIIGCDVLVANLNGRVPDEGMVAEAAMAWANGKLVLGYKADSRSFLDGMDNPLLTGLFDFKIYDRITDVIGVVIKGIDEGRIHSGNRRQQPEQVKRTMKLGAALWETLRRGGGAREVVGIVRNFEC